MSMCAAVTDLERLEAVCVYRFTCRRTPFSFFPKTLSTASFLQYAKDQDAENKTTTGRL